MPKIPTFVTEARPTTQIGARKTNVQVPFSASPFAQLQKPIDTVVNYFQKAEQANNVNEAQKIKNDALPDIIELQRKTSNIANPRVASEEFTKGYKQIVNNKLSGIQNRSVKKLTESSFLDDEYLYKAKVLNASGKKLETETESSLDSFTTTKIAEIMQSGNTDLLKSLPTVLENFYNKYNSVDKNLVNNYKKNIPKKITIGRFYYDLQNNPVRALEALDKGAYPLLIGEDRRSYRDKALSEITKRSQIAEKVLMFNTAEKFSERLQNIFTNQLSEDDIISDGNLKGLPVLQDQMVQLNKTIQENKNAKVPDFDNVIDTAEKIISGDIKNMTEGYRTSMFDVFSKSIIQRSDQFTKDSYNLFAQMFINRDEPNFINNHKNFFEFIKTASEAVKANRNFKNLESTYNQRLNNFYNVMYQRFQKGLNENKNSFDLLNPKSPEYIAKDLYRFIPDSATIMKGLYQGIKKEEPLENVIPRKSGESIEQYQKRIGQ